MILKLDTYGNDKQKECLRHWSNNTTEEILFGGAKGGAKSYTGAACIFHDALVYPDTMYFIARETLSDLTKYTIPTINEVFQNWGIDILKYAKYNGQHNYFRCYNKSLIYLLECSFMPSDLMFERFGSMQFTRGWIEEGGEVSELAYQNLKLGIGRWKNDQYNLKKKLLITCNPKKNWMKYQFIDKLKQGTLEPTKIFIHSDVYDNKKRQLGYEKVLEGLTGTARQRLLCGDWEYDSDDDCLIQSEKINSLYTNSYVPPGEKFITCDIARFGRDKTVIFIWDGLRVIDVEILYHLKTTEVAASMRTLINKYQVPLCNVICDEDGVGGGVVDELGCIGFVNNSTPISNPASQNKENFDNLKSQCYFCLAENINFGKIYIESNLGELFIQDGRSVKELLSQELEQVRQKEVDGEKKKGVVPKEKVKDILGRSPDYSDAMMMRMYFEVAPHYTWTAF